MRTCTAPGCSKKHEAHGYCRRHVTQLRRHGRLTPERERGVERRCCARDCDRLDARILLDDGLAYCRKHARQIRAHGRLAPEREYAPHGAHVGCRALGCRGEHRAKGWCAKHYNARWWAANRALAGARS